MVAILSLGTPRPLPLRPRGGGTSLRFEVGHGDLLVMGGSCQRTWEHAVPKTSQPLGRGSACSSGRAGCGDTGARTWERVPGPVSAEVAAAGAGGGHRDPERAQGGGDQVDGAATGAARPGPWIDGSAGATVAIRRWRSQTCGGQMTFTMPVSSSRLRNTTPRAVGGRCRWVTSPATATSGIRGGGR